MLLQLPLKCGLAHIISWYLANQAAVEKSIIAIILKLKGLEYDIMSPGLSAYSFVFEL